MEYSGMTEEQLVEEIKLREVEVQGLRDAIDAQKSLTPVEHSGLKWTDCVECGNRTVDTAGCNSCSAAKAILRVSENGRE